MLGLVSAESYATPVRGTCYGLSAAIGKTGAAIGTQAFTPIQNNLGKRSVDSPNNTYSSVIDCVNKGGRSSSPLSAVSQASSSRISSFPT